MTFARIIGTGSYLPAKLVTNRDLEKTVDTTDEWIFTRTGIRERHVAAEGELASDLALEASRQALTMAGLNACRRGPDHRSDDYPRHVFPSTACILQAKLGPDRCPAFDVQAVCSGFVYASRHRGFVRSCRASANMRSWWAPRSIPASWTGTTAEPACYSETERARW